MDFPGKIYLFSGKRKSGKDYITDNLYKLLNSEDTALIRISGPVKSEWGKARSLDVDELMKATEYKEQYRAEMVAWTEEVRKSDYGYFCKAALTMYGAYSKRFWVVGDVRRKTDIKWFTEHFPGKIVKIKVVCDEETRARRGWTFTNGIDNAETECDLDDYDCWDRIIVNNGQDLTEVLTELATDLTS